VERTVVGTSHPKSLRYGLLAAAVILAVDAVTIARIGDTSSGAVTMGKADGWGTDG